MEVYQGVVKDDNGCIITVSDVFANEEAVEKWKRNILECFTAILEHNITVNEMKIKKSF